MATAFGRAKKVLEQLEKLDGAQADVLIDGGYIAAVREAQQTGTLPGKEEFRRLLSLDKRLRLTESVELPARATTFRADAYFKTGEGLYVWGGFTSRVVSASADECVLTTSATKLASFDLLKNTVDEHIRAELPADHVFGDLSVFCSHLAGMLDRQIGGTEGPLLNNSYANIFYVQGAGGVVAVSVRWFAGFRVWDVGAFELGDYAWNAGFRAFSAAAVA